MTVIMRLIAWTAAVLGLSGVAAHAADPKPWQLGLPEPVSPTAVEQVWFHDVVLMPIITIITLFVLVLLIYTCWRFSEKRNPEPSRTTHNALLEVAWTMIPVLILVALSIPSLKLLYFSDDTTDSEMTLKITGYQWFWEYSYPDHGDISVEAYPIRDIEQLEDKTKYLMETDNEVVLPSDTKIKLIITSGDVIHNWAVSEFGVRSDAVPGRLNEAPVFIPAGKEGVYYGFCSELCGKDHAYMPIKVRVVPKAEFEGWVKKNTDQAANDTDPAPAYDATRVAEALAAE